MILVKVELHSAITGQVTHLGSMIIANDGTGSETVGNYDAQLVTKDFKQGRHARVEGHRRLSLSVWILVAKALRTLYPKAAPPHESAGRTDDDWIPGRVA